MIPVAEEIVLDEAPAHSAAFRRRRFSNWFPLGITYATFYMGRYNLNVASSEMMHRFGFSKAEFGTIATAGFWTYALAVMFNGPLTDRFGGRRAILVAAAGTAFMNLVIGLLFLSGWQTKVMVGMSLLYAVNQYFQSFGALSIVKVNSHWFHVRERGTFAAVFGVLIRLGLILAFSGVPFILTVLPLRWAFWLPGAFVAVMFAANFLWMRDRPQDAGFEPMDTGEGDVDDGKPAKLGFVLRKVFASRATWLIALCSMMIGMVRRSTVDSWYPKFFTETYMQGGGKLADFLPYQAAAWGIAGLGIAGGFAAGITSDRVYGGRRAPVITFGFIGMAVTLCLLGLSGAVGLGPWMPAVCLAILSFFVNGAHGMVGGAASMDFGGRKAAATAAGMFDGMQYLASSFVGLGMGWVLDHWGWAAWPWVPIPFACAGALLISRLWHVTPGANKHA